MINILHVFGIFFLINFSWICFSSINIILFKASIIPVNMESPKVNFIMLLFCKRDKNLKFHLKTYWVEKKPTAGQKKSNLTYLKDQTFTWTLCRSTKSESKSEQESKRERIQN